MSQILSTKQQTIDLVIEARWIATVNPDNQLLEDCSVVIHEGSILNILPVAQSRQIYLAQETVILDSHVLIPGLINLHTHAAMSLMRGLADDLPLMPWLEQHIWPAEQAVVSERYVQDATLLACAEMLSGGITCFNEMYFYPLAAAMA
ncbi:MAG: amidohydrolase family protein, partial [Methylotenera sp.]|nr:amidohydrolase family protein [Methylotenera sp.]